MKYFINSFLIVFLIGFGKVVKKILKHSKKTAKKVLHSEVTKFIIPIILILFCVFWAVSLRLEPLDLPQAENWARQSVLSQVQSNIQSQISAQNPLLSQTQIQKRTQEELNKILNENSDQLQSQIDTLSSEIKSQFQDDDGQTYLVAIDPYYFYRFYKNIINTGQAGEYSRIVDGENRSFTNFMLAPKETDVTHRGDTFHIAGAVWLYKIVSFFNEDLNPLTLFFIIPAIYAGIATIFAFLVGKKLGGNFGGVFASFYILLHSSVMSRTIAGFSDTDIYVTLFPLIMLYLVLVMFESKKLLPNIIYGVLLALVAFLYSTAWSAWWFAFVFIVLGLIAKVAFTFLEPFFKDFLHHKDFKKVFKKKLAFSAWKHVQIGFIAVLVVFIALCALFLIKTGSINDLLNIPLSIKSSSGLQDATQENLWPNVYTTVAELNPGSWGQIVSSIGFGSQKAGQLGLFCLIIALAMIWFLKKYPAPKRLALIVMFGFWILGSMYATLSGVRFLMLLVLPTGILLSLFFGFGAKKVSEFADTYLQIPQKLGFSILIVILVLIFIGTKPIIAVGYDGSLVEPARQIAMGVVPSMNDAWYDSLIKIKENSDSDAIISSWWDFGHQFITIAQRGATADGGYQNTPQAHWLGKLLLTDSFKESVGILRMLNCDGNNAYDKLLRANNDALQTIADISFLINNNETQARTYLSAQYDLKVVNSVLESTHCEAPESFLITSEDMGCLSNGGSCSGKTGVWAHFGSWNFTKAKIWNIVNDNSRMKAQEVLLQEGFVDSENEARMLVSELKGFSENQANSWIASWPSYYTPMVGCSNNNGTLSCQNGATINLNSLSASISTQGGVVQPHSLVYVDAQKGYQVKTLDKSSDVSIVLKLEGNQYYVMYAMPEVATSTFTRLFYLNDGGEYFEKFNDVRDITGQRIIIWKVNETKQNS